MIAVKGDLQRQIRIFVGRLLPGKWLDVSAVVGSRDASTGGQQHSIVAHHSNRSFRTLRAAVVRSHQF